jgi:transposase InsO family protein
VPEQILTDDGKVFTARFGPGPGPVRFDRICHENGIRHLLTAPYSPTTTGKVERLHKTMRKEYFALHEKEFVTISQAQAALDAWVVAYNTTRPHQAVGMRPAIERFRFAQSPAADLHGAETMKSTTAVEHGYRDLTLCDCVLTAVTAVTVVTGALEPGQREG